MFSQGNDISASLSRRHPPPCNQMHMRLRLKSILERQGISQTELADRIEATRGYVSLLVSNQKQPSVKMMEKIASALDVGFGALFDSARYVPIVGIVGAGATVEMIDAYEKGGGISYVECPPDMPSTGIVAVQVKGDSMQPLIEDGDILFFSRHFEGVDSDALGSVAILQTESDEVYVKQVKPSAEAGRFDLISSNLSVAPIWGARLKWAARMRRHLSRGDALIVPDVGIERKDR